MPDGPESTEDAIRRLERRLGQASETAERLFAEVAAHATGGRGAGATGDPAAGATGDSAKPPPRGWQTPDEPSESQSDLDLLMALVHSVRDLIPPDLQRRLAAAVRELLLALRALIDWYLERIDRRREESVQIQDIPIL
jgi:hypothetical protein